MKAVFFESPDNPCVIKETYRPEPKEGEVLIRVKATSLNRRDYWIKKGIYQGSVYPCIAGSDASGVVEAVGPETDESMVGKEVIVNPAINWGSNPEYHSDQFEILGLPRQGTFAEYICVPAVNIVEKPPSWSFEKASAFPLAGLTAYRALFTRGGLKKGDNILVTGIGGGVSMFLLRFALAVEAKVYVTSSSEKKIKKAIQEGAVNGVLYTENGWEKQLMEMSGNGFELIVDSAAGENFATLLSLIKVGGKIVNFGGTAGKIPAITAAKIFWKQASILGTTMGSPEDFRNMMDFVVTHNIEPGIDKIFPMEDAELAFKLLENHEQNGKVVIKIT